MRTGRITYSGLPRPALGAWLVLFDHLSERLVIELLVTLGQGGDVLPPTGGRDILNRQVLPFRGPEPPKCVPQASVRLLHLRPHALSRGGGGGGAESSEPSESSMSRLLSVGERVPGVLRAGMRLGQ